MIARSVVVLPPAVGETIEVYLNGVRQEPDTDFHRESDTLVFDRTLRHDHIAGWRWLLGASGIGTYRQDDVVDVRYEVDGETRHCALPSDCPGGPRGVSRLARDTAATHPPPAHAEDTNHVV